MVFGVSLTTTPLARPFQDQAAENPAAVRKFLSVIHPSRINTRNPIVVASLLMVVASLLMVAATALGPPCFDEMICLHGPATYQSAWRILGQAEECEDVP